MSVFWFHFLSRFLVFSSQQRSLRSSKVINFRGKLRIIENGGISKIIRKNKTLE